MIKRYNQFVNESKQVPGPGTEGSVRISLSDEESDMFASEPSLEKLISDNKVSLLSPELWYMEDDMETINVLKNYFDIDTDNEDYPRFNSFNLEEGELGFDEENESVRNIDESVDAKGKEDLEKLGKRIKDLQSEYDKKAKELGIKGESYKDRMKRKVAEATARQENKGKKKKVNENIALSNSAARIYIDDYEAEMFTTDPVLQKLISDEKVSLLTPELWFESEDTNTINILRDYFPDVDFDFSDED